jgi:small subunit ribosomal protein S6
VAKNDPDKLVRLDLNNPVFQENLLTLQKQERQAVLDTLNKIRQMTWNQVYRDSGLRWEKIIQKKTTGYYHLTTFKAPGEFINKLEIEYKRDERIMRFLTVSLDKHALAFSEKKRSGAFNKNKETKTEEVAK